MHEIGAFIWIAIVAIGVISSISRRIKAAAPPPATRVAPRVAPRAAPLIAPTAPPSAIRAYAQSAPETPPAPPLPPSAPAPRRAALPVQAPLPAMPEPVLEPMAVVEAPEALVTVRGSRTGGLRGLFEDKRSLVRAVVAAEVLGPPAALREQRLWSPRHSDPST